jgi:hypothetical protein
MLIADCAATSLEALVSHGVTVPPLPPMPDVV